jgi:hypothetical protein
LGHNDRLNAALDDVDDSFRIFRESGLGIAAWQIDGMSAMSSTFESPAHGEPKRGGYAACSGYQNEIRRRVLLALRPASWNSPDAASSAIADPRELGNPDERERSNIYRY